jgi:alpha-L-arabinofuranosidase
MAGRARWRTCAGRTVVMQPWHVSFWGVGNESWGCGGSMTPEYYSNEYNRYSEFCKSYPGSPLKLIASGANSATTTTGPRC